MEMTFTQQIQSINNRGNAVTKITIKGLKCSSVHKDNLVLDFDSSREKDPNNSLSRIVGESYKIEITPAGQVQRVIDARGARAASRVRYPSSKAAARAAAKLLSLDSIKQRHAILALPAADKKQLRPGDSWSRSADCCYRDERHSHLENGRETTQRAGGSRPFKDVR